ncbi:uncharacterized protein LOC135828754 [Sycon ciliatum]|uniref:uncharacterized protein LOC135828754 n=1 Tax=Sycon ciliatum TaxID=27933 RepID=UPI0031F68337
MLKLRHKITRLKWAIDTYNGDERAWPDCYHTVHGDEKWFFLMRDGVPCRVFPTWEENDDGGMEHRITLAAAARVYHKSRCPKVMFLTAIARPRPDHDFDGKVGIWNFTKVRKAKRSNRNTGTVAGETDIVETVTVDADEYRSVMLKKGGVFDAIHTKMWWFKRDSGEPEAGHPIIYQHDGAKPHTAKKNEKLWASHGAQKGFRIVVRTQPAQSPDLNVNDLAFFASLQSDTELVAKENVTDLIHAVESCWQAYPAERMENVWSCPFGSFKGIVDTSGDNSYSHHSGSRTAHRRGTGDRQDRAFGVKRIKEARLSLEEMKKMSDVLQDDALADAPGDTSSDEN